ncbi:hypothetical protein F7725_026961 [Dissostichus mawsoni]|uniref:Uncharacterized protein n=1 Tax=Dissostichus mawsoni TaxID=36200 RepID=A0A7J5X8H8_DISMA|nr:hypothetical protein F7725_026961 [Dissostichus mawsoni]
MSERRLNHLLFLHIHKDLTDGLDLKKVLRSFCFASERRESFQDESIQDESMVSSDTEYTPEPSTSGQRRVARGRTRGGRAIATRGRGRGRGGQTKTGLGQEDLQRVEDLQAQRIAEEQMRLHLALLLKVNPLGVSAITAEKCPQMWKGSAVGNL